MTLKQAGRKGAGIYSGTIESMMGRWITVKILGMHGRPETIIDSIYWYVLLLLLCTPPGTEKRWILSSARTRLQLQLQLQLTD